MKEIEFSRWLFELPAKQHSQFSPSGSTFLPCLSLPTKSHLESSISSIFLKCPHQVDMKNVVKFSKHFFGYFNTLETHSEQEREGSRFFFQPLYTFLSLYQKTFLEEPQSNSDDFWCFGLTHSYLNIIHFSETTLNQTFQIQNKKQSAYSCKLHPTFAKRNNMYVPTRKIFVFFMQMPSKGVFSNNQLVVLYPRNL